jgi:soluble lytic murein transglycosylase
MLCYHIFLSAQFGTKNSKAGRTADDPPHQTDPRSLPFIYMRTSRIVSLDNVVTSIALMLAVLTVACSAQQTEQQALDSLRAMTRDGKLPPESAVAPIESRFAGRKTGALAKLLRARIRYENRDFAGAAAMLNSPDIANLTKLGDHALYLRGLALQQAGDHAGAIAAFEKVAENFPDSIRADQARVAWAASATASGNGGRVPGFLESLLDDHEPSALLATAKAYEATGDQANAIKFYRRTYFYGAGSEAAKEAETKLTSLAQPLTPQTGEEIRTRAEKLHAARNWVEADKAFTTLATSFPAELTPAVNLKRLVAAASAKNMPAAQGAFIAIPASAKEKEQAQYELVVGYAKNRLWADARREAEAMRTAFRNGVLTPKAWADAGLAARDSKLKAEEQFFLGGALANYPNAVEVAQAQFELAWMAHESKDFQRSSQMLIEHLARYVDKDTTNRGKAGYWAARDAERAGRTAEACALYSAVIYRYEANWYGHLAQQRLAAMSCMAGATLSPEVQRAVVNLKTVTVAPETAGPLEMARAEKSDELSTIGLFDWALEELNEAKKKAANSPKINLALARHYRFKGDNVNALLALARSYPDYSQMFPEEMGREEWEIFYPLIHWNDIKHWAQQRSLDPYQVAGLIRQESVFNPRAKSGANAYGLMQLILPTAQTMARKYVASTSSVTTTALLNDPALNIELGTAYMKDQLAKYGRIEYMAVAYNAGPGRVPQWRATLPAEMDEFVEAIPFRETKGYVQGVIRNTAQYRRLYDQNGQFKPNVGSKPLRGEIDTRSPKQIAAEFPEVVVGVAGSSE